MPSASLPGELPSTGVVEFDRLMIGTEQYLRWVEKIESRGFLVQQRALTRGTACEIADRVVTVDPERFRYTDLLHESRHIRQIERAEEQGIDPFGEGRFATIRRAWFERGAYEYEQRLGRKFGFSRDYLGFLEERINHYWKRSYQQELRFSLAAQEHFGRLWR